MRKLCILAIILLVGTFVSAQSINESFEGSAFPPSGWTKISPDGGTGWTTTTVGTTPVPGYSGLDTVSGCPYCGNTVAFCSYQTGGSSSNNQWLVTPQITNIPSTYKLNFWLNKLSFYSDTVNVWISSQGDTLANFTNLVATIVWGISDTGWVNYNYDLSAYAGQSIYIAFQEIAVDNHNNGAAISLDNVQVATNAAIPEISTRVYTNIYPNPVIDNLTIESSSKIKLVKIYSMIGKLVYEKQYNTRTININTSGLKSGVYFLQIDYPEGKMSKKLVIE